MGSVRKLHRRHAQDPRQSQGAGVVAGIRRHLRSETRQRLKIPRRLLALESKRDQIQRLRSVTPADGGPAAIEAEIDAPVGDSASGHREQSLGMSVRLSHCLRHGQADVNRAAQAIFMTAVRQQRGDSQR